MSTKSISANSLLGELGMSARWRIKKLWQAMRVAYLSWRSPEVCIAGVYIPLSRYISNNVREAMFDGGYESAELRTIADNLSSNDRVLEIGTGIGLISTFCAKRIGSERVFTFEANPELIPYIEEVYARNNVSPQLQNSILSEGEGESTFFVHQDFWSSSVYKRTESDKKVTVPRHDINQTIREIRPTFLIMDIEGGESELFSFMDLDGINKLAIELHTAIIGNDRVNEICAQLAKEGFEIDWRYSTSIEGFKKELYLRKPGSESNSTDY